MKKLTTVCILVISLITALCFFNNEPVIAAKKKKSIPKTDALTAELDEATRDFVKREKMPNSVLKAGDIWVLKSYTSQFKAVRVTVQQYIQNLTFAQNALSHFKTEKN